MYNLAPRHPHTPLSLPSSCTRSSRTPCTLCRRSLSLHPLFHLRLDPVLLRQRLPSTSPPVPYTAIPFPPGAVDGVTELGMPPTAATTVHSDSQGTIALGKNPEHHNWHKRTKHIDIQHDYVREQVAAGTVTLSYIGTENMVADVLTSTAAS